MIYLGTHTILAPSIGCTLPSFLSTHPNGRRFTVPFETQSEDDTDFRSTVNKDVNSLKHLRKMYSEVLVGQPNPFLTLFHLIGENISQATKLLFYTIFRTGTTRVGFIIPPKTQFTLLSGPILFALRTRWRPPL